MSTVTGFSARSASGKPVQVDAHGNNAAFACGHCHAPLLAVLREHQRGSAEDKPVTCGHCGQAYWLQVLEAERTLVVHDVDVPDAAASPLPRVVGRPTKDAGRYRLGTSPGGLAPHNQASWNIIAAIVQTYGTADYFDLAVAVRGHKHGDKGASGPQSFVSYCIGRGWLERA